ncbi:hypothetical protein RF11_13398 [Thelohanellus kitauei]|uniref:Uncharacterized protein n=1 Tax=Thelohanellus kitauei TaxID=669202 RepID=A0A0C2LZS0_THEKT|nr:hypothetical protein RF11_13398 [Thelohanellus kitauei]
MTALVCIQMFLLTSFVFLPYLITTSRKKDEGCNFNYTERKYGIVVFSDNDPFTHSVLRDSTSKDMLVVGVLIGGAYISQIFRIFVFQYPDRKTFDFKLICYALTLTSSASGKTFTNIEIINWQHVYNLIPFILSFSDNLKRECVKANVSALIYLPIVIFCLNTIEILLFVLYHMEISINPFRITLLYQKTIIMELNPTNKDYEKLPDIQDETRIEANAN